MAAVAAIVIAFAAGCAGQPEVQSEQPSSGQLSAVDLPGDDYQVPAVTDPLDLRPYVGAPCTLLTDRQTEELGLAEGKSRSDGLCRWPDAEASAQGLAGGPRVTEGLAGFYNQYRTSGTGSWKPLEIGGYPAAHANSDLERRHGQCVLLVGVADDQFLRVEAGRFADGAACDRANDVAESIVANLKEQP